ncbi:hypothetical protein M093_4102 [Bacteroides uniformis str. 3978 T3 i]|uniref:Uncharacterized protein n=1 Tax=Bacteroides uniformis str. 3978 T3 ii TaxID=1339349 RepID=A0A078RZJ0_BACUN|nr:hypothetical protein M094_2728 [Bacteroides uniformis str. 3978 T3 ii]KDS57464.1 hypothetical protein M093_4102 [Bacteroides uniformis str. 3978 T3 i]
MNNFQINIHNLFCEKTLQYMEAPVKTLFCRNIEEIQEFLCLEI